MNKQVLPNLFVVGVAKAGTSAFMEMLGQHSDIFVPKGSDNKEPSYFASIKNNGRLSFERYMSLFQIGIDEGFRYVAEGSTAYFKEPGVAERLWEFNPSAKLIVILRNPVDRAYSLYNWMVQHGYEPKSSFNAALKEEEYRYQTTIPNFWEPEYKYNYYYKRSGLYFDQLSTYIKVWGNKLLVLKFDDYKDDYVNTMNKTFSFLGLPPQKVKPITTNPSKDVHHPLWQFWMRKIGDAIDAKLYPSTKKVSKKLLAIGTKHHSPKPMSSAMKDELCSYYRNDIIKTMQLTGLDLDNWLK